MIDGKVESALYASICGDGVRVLLGTKSAYGTARTRASGRCSKSRALRPPRWRSEAAPGARFRSH
jgi:hypothetical protein